MDHPSSLGKQFLIELRLNPLFREALKDVKKFRPIVPAYKPCQTKEEEFSLMERIKSETMRQEGFDLIYLLLTGEKVNE